MRVKNKYAKALSGMAFEVNQVWNAANELTAEYAWVPIPGVGYMNCNTSEYDLQKELRILREDRDLSIGAATVQSVIAQHALGWIPFKAAGVKRVNGQFRFCGHFFSLWDSYDLSKHELGTGSFSQDARGRWYFNTTVKVEVTPSASQKSVGIDLGLKTTGTARCTIGMSMPRRTFSAWGIKRSMEESPLFPRKRQPLAEGAKEVNYAHYLFCYIQPSSNHLLQCFYAGTE